MIKVQNIVKTYGVGDTVVKALNDVSINFRKSEFVSILGPSGCGKTTLLNILGGLDRYDSGDIVINGISTKNYKDGDWDTYRNHYIGFVFQSYNLIPHLSVIENVELALSIGGTKKAERRSLAMKALEKVGLSDQAKKKPNQMSGGQMQRVAIARAIVNNPKVILADEPTGALDSETSVQVMEILKEISKDRLVIMVTHNQELAKTYSTRIINMLDGKKIGDTQPFEGEKEQPKAPEKTKKSAMKMLTAFSLSFKNLITKKAKTLLTSFAGSIGIIGIALVLAVSTGMTNYINKMQSDALGNYPITISAITIDMNKFADIDITPGGSGGGSDDGGVQPEVEELTPYNKLSQYMVFGHYNNLKTSFVEHVKAYEQKDKQNGDPSINVIEYSYYTPIKMLVKNGDKISFHKRENATSIMAGGISSSIYPMVDNMDFVMDQYDLIYGDMPENLPGKNYSTDLLLVIDEDNKIPDSVLKDLGIKFTPKQDGTYEKIKFEDICKQEYKLLTNDDFYIPNSTNFDEITSFDKITNKTQAELLDVYNNGGLETMRITGILRIKKDAKSEILAPGLVYMNSLEEFYKQNCKDSLIARKQLANKEQGNYAFFDNYKIDVAELALGGMSAMPIDGFVSIDHINQFLNGSYGYTLPEEEAFDLAMQQIGISNIPISIKFYPKNFSAKAGIINMINEYNEAQTDKHMRIVYSDSSELLTNTLGSIVDIVSYVLIAFAAISLVVSSIMIGIITYTSVIERTKEIGVLRSIGARKKDISRVFNMETFIIGLTAGTIGVLVTFILTFPISSVLSMVTGGIATNLAVLKIEHMIALIAISIILTLTAGLVPARIASKKDPVKALRVE